MPDPWRKTAQLVPGVALPGECTGESTWRPILEARSRSRDATIVAWISLPSNRPGLLFTWRLPPETCLGELLRHVTVEHLPHLNDYRLSELSLDLEVICDCRDMSAIGLAPADLWHDTDFRVTQELAASTIARGAEGMLVPSATRLGDNLVLFPTQLRPTSLISVIGSRDPRLHVPRS
jgi:hypothetical protein